MRILTWSLAFILIALPMSVSNAASVIAKAPQHAETCGKAVAAAEQEYRLPKRLLTAVSLTESGHWHKEKQEMIAWPWTVYAEGRGRYLPSKEDAIKEVKTLKAKGVKNIDVGCMQVNLHYHPEAFEDLEAALDPKQNTQYAAKLLKSLREESRSWNIAIAHYHSRTQKFNVPYRKKVLRIWQNERRKDTETRMAATREAYKLKREQLAERIKEASQRRFTKENQQKLAMSPPS
ncbi:transglycosylase SLT domain-containing protein [Sneathiella sp.]|uniref:transglycosylase SLT domain-containing protein n=1 Tax=Sneathiella sp. TaxID=1964365 RepID=UPI0026344225|nr:transglycosylase SLT domain-containing protein [Sneathiella sp.]MDF2366182.1 transglycosylase SLT domain-containing protein [Sneathiella sp.]